MRRWLLALLFIFLFQTGHAAFALTQTLEQPLIIRGTTQKPAVVLPYTFFDKPSPGLQPSYCLYDLDISSIKSELSTYRLIYGIGQVIHGAAYTLRR